VASGDFKLQCIEIATVSSFNVMCKYADNIDLLVLECSDVSLQEEFYNVKSSAEDNTMLNTG